VRRNVLNSSTQLAAIGATTLDNSTDSNAGFFIMLVKSVEQ
jgi:hypothetical protein